MSLAGRIGARGSLLLASTFLAACTVQPHVGGAANGDLRPLAKQPALPPGAPARSDVPSVRYDLAVSGAGEQIPDGGLPGDNNREVFERGGASWYGLQFHLRKTASGERFDMTALTAAHKTLPFNTRVCVRSLVNGREVLVRINDRGPYVSGRVIDLSRAAADAIGLPELGIKQVALSVVDKDDDHCGGTAVGADDLPPPPDSVPKLFARQRR
jgi:rare lipoprotein A